MRVFCDSLPLGTSDWVYDGWRRGISGLGGAGARGYFVIEREAAGDVGDLRVAGEISFVEIAPEPLLCVLVDCALRCFLCRKLSSLWSLIRIDRLAGAISSGFCRDFDRVCRAEPDAARSVSLTVRSRSESESDDMPDEEEFEEVALDTLMEVSLPVALFLLL